MSWESKRLPSNPREWALVLFLLPFVFLVIGLALGVIGIVAALEAGWKKLIGDDWQRVEP